MADIGDKLRSARKAKGMSIEDIERITKIQRRYLNAIENNDFDQLPGDFYVRAFIKQYAQVVGLNGKELLNDYHKEVPESKPEEYVENSIDNKSEEVKRTTNNKKGLWKTYLPKAAAIVGVFLVIFVVYLVYTHFFAGGNNQQASNQAENVTVSSSSESSSSKQSHKKSTSAKSKIKLEKLANNSYRVLDWSKAKNRDLKVATGADSTWAQVTVDGNVVWQGTLEPEGSHTVKLSKEVKSVAVQFGNSRSTKLSLDGKDIEARNKNNPNALLNINFVFGHASRSTNSTNSNTQSSVNQRSYNYNNNSSTTQNYSSNQTQNNQTTTNRNQTTQNQQPQNNQSSQVQSSTQPVQNNQATQTSGNTGNQGQANGGQNRQ